VAGNPGDHARWRLARVAEAGLGVATVALVGLLGLMLFGAPTGLVAMGLAAIYPPLVLPSASILSESLFIPLELGAVLAALHARASPRRLTWALAAGVLVGLAALTRSNGILLVPVLALAVWHPPSRTRAALGPALALAAAALLTIAPWMVRNATSFDALVPVSTQDGFALAGQYNAASQDNEIIPAVWQPPVGVAEYAPLFRQPGLDEAELSAELRSRSLDFIRDHPGSVIKATYWNTRRALSGAGARPLERIAGADLGIGTTLSDASVIAFWIAALLGIAGALTPAARRAPLVVWVVLFVLFVSIAPISGLTRYRLPCDPFVLLLAALALTAGAARLAARAHRASGQTH